MVLRLRPLVRGDFQDWQDMRIADQHILQPVEPTVMGDWEDAHSKRQWWQQLLQLRSAADAGTVVPLAIEVNGRFAGQLTLGAIQHGVGSDCWVGYWVHSALSGQGVATAGGGAVVFCGARGAFRASSDATSCGGTSGGRRYNRTAPQGTSAVLQGRCRSP